MWILKREQLPKTMTGKLGKDAEEVKKKKPTRKGKGEFQLEC